MLYGLLFYQGRRCLTAPPPAPASAPQSRPRHPLRPPHPCRRRPPGPQGRAAAENGRRGQQAGGETLVGRLGRRAFKASARRLENGSPRWAAAAQNTQGRAELLPRRIHKQAALHSATLTSRSTASSAAGCLGSWAAGCVAGSAGCCCCGGAAAGLAAASLAAAGLAAAALAAAAAGLAAAGLAAASLGAAGTAGAGVAAAAPAAGAGAAGAASGWNTMGACLRGCSTGRRWQAFSKSLKQCWQPYPKQRSSSAHATSNPAISPWRLQRPAVLLPPRRACWHRRWSGAQTFSAETGEACCVVSEGTANSLGASGCGARTSKCRQPKLAAPHLANLLDAHGSRDAWLGGCSCLLPGWCAAACCCCSALGGGRLCCCRLPPLTLLSG